ncbi:MAG: beta-mannosidase [Frankiales bacterium]|nr:beta-mannosidase [Frankiales bacterium]
MTLLTDFELTSTDEGEPAADAVWIPAVVPGGVHESLLAAGLIGHPYFGNNEAAVAWIEEKTWWYRASFPGLEGERVTLAFDGLDTVADVWLNGTLVGSHANQHRPLVLDVTGVLRQRNDLLLRFLPPLRDTLAPDEIEAAAAATRARQAAVRPQAEELPLEDLLLLVRRSVRRKATFSWGWDFGARVPSVGLLNSVTLTQSRVAAIAGVHARTTALDVTASTATMTVAVELDCFGGRPEQVRVVLTSPSGAVVEKSLPAGDSVEVELSLHQAQLWWMHDLGDQPLYDLEVTLVDGSGVLDTWTGRVGVRTVVLDRSEGPDGRVFRFLLNGVPVFARGVNWVPASLLVGSIPADTYRDLISLAQRAQMTMIRVWGGGIYEPQVFYDACDELGILVWQDFMFACFDYPSDNAELTAEVELEAVHQVRRLRNHASLALWCGNNEVQAIHELTNGNVEPGPWGWSYFHELLPAVVAVHDPATPYWPGSPWGETDGELVNGVSDGDRHAWEVWHGIPIGAGGPTEFETRGEAVHFHRYAYDEGTFISEFGIHAAPELSTLERWTTPGSLELRNEAFDQRNKDTPKDKGYALMERETGVPTTMAEYVDFSMACQAEGLKFGIEHYRRRQPRCGGTLVWQFNDVWPGFSWSVVDHDLVAKAGYYFLQRAYQPLIASFTVTDQGLELWVTNSVTRDVPLDLVVEVATFRGDTVLREEVSVVAGAYASARVWSSPVVPTPDQYAWVSSPSAEIEPNRCFFGFLKDLPLDGVVDARTTWTGETTAEVELTSRGYSYFAHVLSPHPGARFESNYVDLRNGEKHVIRVSGLQPGADLRVASYGSRD